MKSLADLSPLAKGREAGNLPTPPDTPALDRLLAQHARSCAYWIFSGDRHCSCGRDEAVQELETMKGVIMVTELLEQLTEAYAQRDLLNLATADAISNAIPPEVQKAMADISAEFAPKAEAVENKIAELEYQVRQAVLEAGASAKGGALQAVYAKGRTTWDSKILEGLMIAVPQLAQARNEGKPSVSIRRVG